ncbi:MAG: GNAT family N-acetyltransferase [Deltaproteobacteria bacterium]|nr:GNAT family N-acetyltransferase [Deltaproteobacteria bacterium]
MALVEPTHVTTKDGRTAVIRNATEDDAQALLDDLRDFVEDGEGQVLVPGELAPTLDEERAWIRGQNDDSNKLLLVVEIGGAIVGNLTFATSPRRRIAHTGTFGVGLAREARGIGIGTALVTRLLAWAADHPTIEKVNLRVLATNARAIAMYRKLGFVEEGRLVREIRYEDGTYCDDVSMARFVRRAG